VDLKQSLRNAFAGKKKKQDWVLVAVFIVINMIVLINAFIHNPEMGYDAEGHLNYITMLPGKLPNYAESTEFFSPPLPYILPALVYQPCHAAYGDAKLAESSSYDCRKVAGKVMQGMGVLVSVACTLLFLMILEELKPGEAGFKRAGLALFALMPVYYKSMAQVRGEPYVLLFGLLLLVYVLRLLRKKSWTWKQGAWLGVILGLLLLSRQWGFFFYPPLAVLAGLLWLADKKRGVEFGKLLAIAVVVSLLVGGWFYWHLYENFGAITAFNQIRAPFSFTNKPLSFYRSTGLGDLLLFKNPIRPVFDNQFLPSFYSDMWGDYWGFWVYIRDNSYLGQLGLGNAAQIAPYLGSANLAGVLPTLALAGGVGLAVAAAWRFLRGEHNRENMAAAFLLAILGSSFAGFLYFVITVPNAVQGDTVKASYLLSALMLMPVFGAEFVVLIIKKWPRTKRVLGALFLGLFVWLLPAMISRYY
jgi:hypothetical protein